MHRTRPTDCRGAGRPPVGPPLEAGLRPSACHDAPRHSRIRIRHPPRPQDRSARGARPHNATPRPGSRIRHRHRRPRSSPGRPRTGGPVEPGGRRRHHSRASRGGARTESSGAETGTSCGVGRCRHPATWSRARSGRGRNLRGHALNSYCRETDRSVCLARTSLLAMGDEPRGWNRQSSRACIYCLLASHISTRKGLFVTKRLIDLDETAGFRAARGSTPPGCRTRCALRCSRAVSAAARARQLTWLREGGLEALADPAQRADVWR